MPLRYTGVKMPMESATTYQARNPQGGSIAVQISHEVLRDYGEARAKDKGVEKYDAGQILDGTKVTVRGSDFE